MKAFVIHDGGRKTSIIEKDAPTIQNPTDVLVKIKGLGICGTDMHIYEGKHPMCFNTDRIPGHEFSGEVIEIGSAVTDLAVGDHVVHEPIAYCGECYPCRRGQHNVCTSLKVTGCNIDGGWQELYCAPEKQWHKIPDWMSWEQGALVEPYTIAAQVCSQADIQEGDIVLIHGAGPVGLMCLDTAKNLGAIVIISEISPGRIELASKMGADHVVNPMEDEIEDFLAKNGFDSVNVVLDCVGLANMMERNMKMLSPAGRFVPVAACPIHIEQGGLLLVKQLTLIGSRLQKDKFKPVIENFKLFGDHCTEMVTNVFPFEKSGEAFEYADARHPTCGKIVVRFD